MITIELPWPAKELSPNSRCHWREKAEAAAVARLTGYVLALNNMEDTFKCQPMELKDQKITYTFHPPTKRRMDDDNAIAMMKSYRDGVAEAYNVDDSKFYTQPAEWGAVVRGGKVILRLEEME